MEPCFHCASCRPGADLVPTQAAPCPPGAQCTGNSGSASMGGQAATTLQPILVPYLEDERLCVLFTLISYINFNKLSLIRMIKTSLHTEVINKQLMMEGWREREVEWDRGRSLGYQTI